MADARPTTHGAPARSALGLMVLSGFTGLGLQIVWTQQAASWLGHDAAAVLAVITAFFSGLALGSLVLGRRIARSDRPWRWYAGCEAVIALWTMAVVALFRPATAWAQVAAGPSAGPVLPWAIAFGGTLVLLLPATAAMGATLPAMERVRTRLDATAHPIAALYAANTLGATLGVVATAFWLVPTLGLVRAACVCATCNLLCALVALQLDRTAAQCPPRSADPVEAATNERRSGRWMRLAVTGFLGIGYEVVVVRVLGQVTQDTVYTYALTLAIYLVGTAFGAALLHHGRTRAPRLAPTSDGLISMLAAACLLGVGGLWGAERLRDAVARVFGGGMGATLIGEALLAVVALALPTMVMGALFSDLCDRARAAGLMFHRSLAANTLGAAAAPIVFGAWLIPAFGPKLCLLLVTTGYLLLVQRRLWRSPPVAGVFAVVAGVAIAAPPLAFVDVPRGGHVVSYREGALAAVSVVEDAAGVLRLRIDNRQQEGDSASVLADSRQALLPVLLHPDPHRALFLGLGTGTTAAAAARDPSLQVDAVELLPEVIDASSLFRRAEGDAMTAGRLHLIAGDARRYVRAAGLAYDVIVADNFHPARSGSGALYTVEHFAAVRDRLAPGGLFCQWLPLHQLDAPTLRSIVRSYLAAYPGAMAVLATNSLQTPVLGLVARRGAERFDPSAVRARLQAEATPLQPSAFGFADEFAMLGAFVAGPSALTRYAGDAPLNTDDHPVVAYLAPRLIDAPDSSPGERLLALLGALTVTPAEVIGTTADTAWTGRLAAYWAARDRFIAAGRHVQPSPNVHAMLAAVRGPLLAVLRQSPDFRPAYDPLLRMAEALAANRPDDAVDLLTALERVQPARPEAAALRWRILAPARDGAPSDIGRPAPR